jgi:hypothetical protein
MPFADDELRLAQSPSVEGDGSRRDSERSGQFATGGAGGSRSEDQGAGTAEEGGKRCRRQVLAVAFDEEPVALQNGFTGVDLGLCWVVSSLGGTR